MRPSFNAELFLPPSASLESGRPLQNTAATHGLQIDFAPWNSDDVDTHSFSLELTRLSSFLFSSTYPPLGPISPRSLKHCGSGGGRHYWRDWIKLVNGQFIFCLLPSLSNTASCANVCVSVEYIHLILGILIYPVRMSHSLSAISTLSHLHPRPPQRNILLGISIIYLYSWSFFPMRLLSRFPVAWCQWSWFPFLKLNFILSTPRKHALSAAASAVPPLSPLHMYNSGSERGADSVNSINTTTLDRATCGKLLSHTALAVLAHIKWLVEFDIWCYWEK